MRTIVSPEAVIIYRLNEIANLVASLFKRRNEVHVKLFI